VSVYVCVSVGVRLCASMFVCVFVRLRPCSCLRVYVCFGGSINKSKLGSLLVIESRGVSRPVHCIDLLWVFFTTFVVWCGVCAVVTTMAGGTMQSYVDGTGTVARFNNPSGIAFDLNGNLIITDYKNNLIRRVTLAGGAKVSRLWWWGVCTAGVRCGLQAR
jgi:hypothetical protein